LFMMKLYRIVNRLVQTCFCLLAAANAWLLVMMFLENQPGYFFTFVRLNSESFVKQYVPVWFGINAGLLVAALALAACRGFRVVALRYAMDHRRRMTMEGTCPTCGYPLKGLPEDRCPECGVPFERYEAGERVRRK
jgi:hypothetical protein